MLNTRRVRMPKRKDGYRENRGKRRRSVRQEISDTVFADARNASLVTTFARNTNFLRISLSRRKWANYTRVRTAAMATIATSGYWTSLERGKFTVHAIKFSLSHYPDP